MVLDLGKGGRRLTLENQHIRKPTPTPNTPKRTRNSSKHKYNKSYDHNSKISMADLAEMAVKSRDSDDGSGTARDDSMSMKDYNARRKSARLQNKRTSAIVGHQLALLTTNSNKGGKYGKYGSASAQTRRRSSSNGKNLKKNYLNLVRHPAIKQIVVLEKEYNCH